MEKDDLYFLIGTVLAIAGLLGTDWSLLAGRLTATKGRRRSIFTVCMLVGSLTLSGFGWYKAHHLKPESVSVTVSAYQPASGPLTVISGKTFENADIPLDGHIYDHS